MEYFFLDLSIVKKELGFDEFFLFEYGIFDNMMLDDFYDISFYLVVSVDFIYMFCSKII